MKKYLLFALPLVALCACNKEVVEPSVNNVQTITAVANNDTKSRILQSGTDSYTMYWVNGDGLRVRKLLNELPSPATSNRTAPSSSYFTYSGPSWVTTADFVGSMPGSFGDGIYIACKGEKGTTSTTGLYYGTTKGSTTINEYCFSNLVDSLQVRNNIDGGVGTSIGIANDRIPVYATITDDATHVSFDTNASIIKVNLTNSTSNSIVGIRIVLSTDLTGTKEGIAGREVQDVNPVTGAITPRTTNYMFSATHARKRIVLTSLSTLSPGETKPYGIVLVGGHNVGNLTYEVYDTAETPNLLATASTSARVLQRKVVYTKSISITEP